MANELHLLYLLTPVSLSFRVNWRLYHQIYKRLLPIEQRICDQIGISESHIVAYCHGQENATHAETLSFKREVFLSNDEKSIQAFQELNHDLIVKQRHVRFFTTLLLKDLLQDQPIERVAQFYGLTVGEIQAF